MSKITVLSRQQRGSYLKLKLSNVLQYPCSSYSYSNSGFSAMAINKIGTVSDLAHITLKIEDKDAKHHKLSIKFWKHELAKDTVKLRVTSKDGNVSTEWVCPDSPNEDWMHIADLQSARRDNGYGTTAIDLTIAVYELKTTTFANLYDDTDLVDFHLKADNGSVGVHKLCLAAHSDAFKAMFTGEWKEKEEGVIQIQGTTAASLQHLKEYIYLGILPEDEWLKPLLALAALYMMDDLKAACIAKLVATVSSRDLFSLIEFACDYKLPELCFSLMQHAPDDVVNEACLLKRNKNIDFKAETEEE